MSILIRGMEMPKRCCSCFLCYADQDSEHNVDWICAPLCKIVNKGSIIQPEIKLDDCPLVELPPHGDLIDRDALMKDGWLSLWKRVDYMGGYAIHDLPLINPSIPVILESEE